MEARELRLLRLFRLRTSPADQELKKEVETQLAEAKDNYESARQEGVPLPAINWDIADPEVILRLQEGFGQLQEGLTYRKPKRGKTE